MNWILIPICAWLWRQGGERRKDFRRYGIPLLLTGAAMFQGFSFSHILMGFSYALIFRLPFTLIGDDINESVLNWVWIPFWGILLPLSSMFIGGMTWANVIAGAVITLFAVLSNLKATRHTVTWPLCENVFGAAIAFPVVICLNQ